MRIRCNNCMKIFESEDDLARLYEHEDGTMDENCVSSEFDGTGSEAFDGCPDCKTDGYLTELSDE